MDNCTLHVRGSVNLTIYLYAATIGQRGMLYIRKFYAVNLYCIYHLSIYIKTSCVYACLLVCKKELLHMTSLFVHKALYMHRQWESQECCIFASFT